MSHAWPMWFPRKKRHFRDTYGNSPGSGSLHDTSGEIVRQVAQPPPGSDPCLALHRAVDELRNSIDSHVLQAGPVIDRLIDIWSLACQIDPAAAKPAEVALSGVAGRDSISAVEIYATCEQIETAVAGSGRAHASA